MRLSHTKGQTVNLFGVGGWASPVLLPRVWVGSGVTSAFADGLAPLSRGARGVGLRWIS